MPESSDHEITSYCPRCGINTISHKCDEYCESPCSEAKCAQNHEEDGAEDCLFRCHKCGTPKASGERCVRTISVKMLIAMPLAAMGGEAQLAIDKSEEEAKVLLGEIILLYAQTERNLWELIPRDNRGRAPNLFADLDMIAKIHRENRIAGATQGEARQAIGVAIQRIRALGKRFKSKRDVIAHGRITGNATSSITIGEGESYAKESASAPHSLVLDKDEVELTAAHLQAIVDDGRKLLSLIGELQLLIQRVNRRLG